MKVTSTQQDSTVTLAIEGRVDTLTSPELQDAVLKAMQSTSKLILDFAQVQYISSAGLRVLLIGQKMAASKGGSMELHNVTEAVMAVLKTVGFDKVITIK